MFDEVSYEKYIGIDKANQRSFEPVKMIPCRLVNEHVVIKLGREEEVVSNQTVFTTTPITEHDRINGLDVLEVFEYKSLLDGEVWGYRVRI